MVTREANEFVQGDLRDVDFVSRVIQYKGEHGNFYNHIPYRLVRPFDEIYQFAADMGGAGFVFTGEERCRHHAQLCHHQPQCARRGS